MPADVRASASRKSFIQICQRSFSPGRRKTRSRRQRESKKGNTGLQCGWAKWKNQNVANKLFDMAVNMGVRQAAVYAQRAINALVAVDARVMEDGVIGPKTLAAINAADSIAYYQLLREFSAVYYQHLAAVNPAQAVNLQGWMKRAEA